MDVDEVWAYLANHNDDVTPVRVLRLGVRRPSRVLVRFEDPTMEGREQWVPPSRLKVPWDYADAFRTEQAQWSALRTTSPRRDSTEVYAATEVFERVAGINIAELATAGGYLVVHDLVALGRLSGVALTEIVGHPDTFRYRNHTIVPWPTALTLARALAEHHSDVILAAIAEDEARYRYEAVHGRRYLQRGTMPGWQISPEAVRAIDLETEQPRRALLKQWCGTAALSRWDDIQQLRDTIRRISGLACEAVEELRAAGSIRAADRLTRQLEEIERGKT